jgi:hypothetical protein
MSDERDIVERLRGQYTVEVRDGAGPLLGLNDFTRKFDTPPIQHEAASIIETLRRERALLAAECGAWRDRAQRDSDGDWWMSTFDRPGPPREITSAVDAAGLMDKEKHDG